MANYPKEEGMTGGIVGMTTSQSVYDDRIRKPGPFDAEPKPKPEPKRLVPREVLVDDGLLARQAEPDYSDPKAEPKPQSKKILGDPRSAYEMTAEERMKQQGMDALPLVFRPSSRTERVIQMVELRGSVYVATETGVYRVEGDKAVALTFGRWSDTE